MKPLCRFLTRSCLVMLPLSASAVVIGQIDTFEDGTTAGWHVPGESPTPPTNVATGGPAGAGDNFMRLTSLGGNGPGSRLSVLSGPQWSGNYIAAGIGQIVMDVNNLGPSDLYLRLLFEDLSNDPNAPPNNLALSANAAIVTASSGWQRIAFDISLSGLVPTLGTVSGALAGTDVVRLFHNPSPTFPGPGIGIPAVSVQLGVDNIQAASARVPESFSPAGLMLCVSLCFGIIARLKRRLASVR